MRFEILYSNDRYKDPEGTLTGEEVDFSSDAKSPQIQDHGPLAFLKRGEKHFFLSVYSFLPLLSFFSVSPFPLTK